MAVSVRDLIRPARPAMILSGVLTAAGAVLGIVPFVALTQLAAVWLRERSDPGWSGNPWLLIGIAAGALLGAQLLYLAGIGVTHLAEARLRHRLRQQIVDAIGRLPLGEVARIPHGTIRKMVCDDTSAIHTLVAHIPGDVRDRRGPGWGRVPGLGRLAVGAEPVGDLAAGLPAGLRGDGTQLRRHHSAFR